MKKILTLSLAALLAASLGLLPGSAVAKSKRGRACPRNARVDRNRDRIPDRWECRNGLSLSVKQTRRDPDRDGLNNLQEFRAGTNPRDPDSDDNGIPDGRENIGTIASFTPASTDPNSGSLTINVVSGGTLTAQVTPQTECKVQGAATARSARGGGDDSRGDDRGRDENEVENENENEGCRAADLTVGRSVREAEVAGSGTGPVFRELKLGA